MTTNLKERAREFLHRQVIQLWESQEAYDEAVANLSALLIQVQVEARLEEAKWWHLLFKGPTSLYHWDAREERIAALAAQAAAPAKETK